MTEERKTTYNRLEQNNINKSARARKLRLAILTTFSSSSLSELSGLVSSTEEFELESLSSF